MLKELSSYIYDIAGVCLELGAARLDIEIDEEPANDLLTVIISNDINRQIAYNPQHKPSHGISLLSQACDLCGGRLTARYSAAGSKLVAIMQYSHADRPPMGGVPCLIRELIMSNPDIDIYYTHRYNGREYKLSTSQIKSMLDGVPFDTPSAAAWIQENIGEGLTHIIQAEVMQ
ncbi:MAG: hypothetical protein LBB94_11305 [Clostridiales bacterium]|nr:hypothetical protein [Clostridiales bacterium]